MAVDLIRYDLLAQDALRAVVKKVLGDVADRGIPGEHHFYISFDTRAGGVDLSSRLRERYPEEMTIVLQHQFWDLVVEDEKFEVGVSFNGIPERLTVPFAAIKGFYDPSVQFGLQFELVAEPKQLEKDAAQDTEKGSGTDSATGKKSARGNPRGAASEPEETRPRTSVPSSRKKQSAARQQPRDEAAEKADEETPAESAQVVSLDKFRKK